MDRETGLEKNHFEKSLRLAHLKAVRAWEARSDIPGGCYTVALDLAKQAFKAGQLALASKKSSVTADEAYLLAVHMSRQADKIGKSFNSDAWSGFAKVCEAIV